MRTERCENDNINIYFDGAYEDVMDRLEDRGVEVQTRTPHMSIVAYDDQQFIVKSDRLVLPMDDMDAAEAIAADVLGDMVAE